MGRYSAIADCGSCSSSIVRIARTRVRVRQRRAHFRRHVATRNCRSETLVFTCSSIDSGGNAVSSPLWSSLPPHRRSGLLCRCIAASSRLRWLRLSAPLYRAIALSTLLAGRALMCASRRSPRAEASLSIVLIAQPSHASSRPVRSGLLADFALFFVSGLSSYRQPIVEPHTPTHIEPSALAQS